MTAAPQLPYADTLHVKDHCLCLHTQRAARALARRFDEALRPVGLTNGQFSLLMSLNRPKPASLGDVAGLLGADRTTLTAALKPLVREGLATVETDPSDSRRRLISLTPAGHARLIEALPIWKREHGALEAGMSDGQPGELRRGLDHLAAYP